MTARKGAAASAQEPLAQAERPARVSTQLREERLRAEALKRYIAQLERDLEEERDRRPSIVPAFALAAAFGVAVGLTFAGAELVLQWLGWLS